MYILVDVLIHECLNEILQVVENFILFSFEVVVKLVDVLIHECFDETSKLMNDFCFSPLLSSKFSWGNFHECFSEMWSDE